jgi:amino acid permease
MFKEFKLNICNVVMVFVMLIFKLIMDMGMLGANLKHYLGADSLRCTKILSQHHLFIYFYHVKTHLWMIMMESRIVII